MTTYYVSTAGNGGSDSNPGTSGSPFLTVAHAAAVATTSGDLIHVNPGTFSETAQVALAVGVSLEGAGITSIIKAGYTADTNPANTFIGLISASEGTLGNQSISQLKFDGNATTGRACIMVRGRSNVLIHDVTIVDFLEYAVTFNGRVVETVGPPAIYAIGNQFYNNTVTNCSAYSGGFGRGALQIGGQDQMVIHHNTMTQLGRASGTNGYLIKLYMDGYLKGIQIYNNTITKEPFDGTTFDFAIELWHILGGMQIYNNTIIGDSDLTNGIQKGTYPYAIDFHHNTIGPLAQSAAKEIGLTIEGGASDVIIRDNYFKNLHTHILLFNQSVGGPETYNNISIYSNIFDGVGKSTGGGGGGSVFWPSGTDNTGTYTNFNIWNNTLYGRYAAAYDGIQVDGIGHSIGWSVRNNIIVGFQHVPIVSYLINSGSTIDTLSIENNIFFGNVSNTYDQAEGITPTNLTLQNNGTSDPKFVSTSDFHLQSTSPAINAGLTLGLTSDFDSVPIPQGPTPDIGAYEYGVNQLLTGPWVSGDRVKETTTTTGTGTITLLGAVAGFQAFSAIAGAGNVVVYTIVHQTLPEWEVGIGQWAVGNTLLRGRVLASSGFGSLVVFSAGTKNVFCDYPATHGIAPAVNRNALVASLIPAGSSIYVTRSYALGVAGSTEIGAGAVLEVG